jgi:hypothetical protein
MRMNMSSSPSPIAQPAAPAPALATLVEALGDRAVAVVPIGAGLATTVSGVSLYDPLVAPQHRRAHLVLGVGVDLAAADALGAATMLARAGAAALAVRGSYRRADLERWAADAGLTVIALAATVPWEAVQGAAAATLSSLHAADVVPEAAAELHLLADAIADLLDAAVVIDDPHLEGLAFSSRGQPIDTIRQESILARRFPAALRRTLTADGTFAQMAAGDVVRIAPPNGRLRLGAAVRTPHEVLGYIFAVEGSTPFDVTHERLLRGMASAATAHLLEARRRTAGQQASHEALAVELLEGRSRAAATRLGLGHDLPLRVVAFAAAAAPELTVGATDRLRRLVELSAPALPGLVAVTAQGATTYAICGDDGRASVPRGVDEVVGRVARGLGLDVRAGIGEPHADAALSRRQADEALAVLARERRDGAARFADIRARALLAACVPLAASDWLGGGPAHAIVAHDAAHATPYAHTLRVYLAAHGSMAAAAEQLVVHVSTLRYRLGRIADRFGLELDDPEARLALELELRCLADGTP